MDAQVNVPSSSATDASICSAEVAFARLPLCLGQSEQLTDGPPAPSPPCSSAAVLHLGSDKSAPQVMLCIACVAGILYSQSGSISPCQVGHLTAQVSKWAATPAACTRRGRDTSAAAAVGWAQRRLPASRHLSQPLKVGRLADG